MNISKLIRIANNIAAMPGSPEQRQKYYENLDNSLSTGDAAGQLFAEMLKSKTFNPQALVQALVSGDYSIHEELDEDQFDAGFWDGFFADDDLDKTQDRDFIESKIKQHSRALENIKQELNDKDIVTWT